MSFAGRIGENNEQDDDTYEQNHNMLHDLLEQVHDTVDNPDRARALLESMRTNLNQMDEFIATSIENDSPNVLEIGDFILSISRLYREYILTQAIESHRSLISNYIETHDHVESPGTTQSIQIGNYELFPMNDTQSNLLDSIIQLMDDGNLEAVDGQIDLLGPLGGRIREGLQASMDEYEAPTHPLPDELIDKLDHRPYHSGICTNDTCPITLRLFQNDQIVSILPCNHAYEPDEIVKWFETQSTCPVCRFECSTYEPWKC